MNQNQSDQSHVVGEMFDAANIAQPVPQQGIPGSITAENIQLPTENNGFTSDDIQQPAPAPEPAQESGNE